MAGLARDRATVIVVWRRADNAFERYMRGDSSEDSTDAVMDGWWVEGVRDTLNWATGRRGRLANDNSPDGPNDRFDGSAQHLRSAVLTYPIHSLADQMIVRGVRAAAAWLLGETDTEPVDANGYGQLRGLGTKAS